MTTTMTRQELLYLMAAAQHAETGTGRQIRQKAGLSMRDVAASLGIGHDRLGRWETGQVRPRGKVGAQWAELLEELEKRLNASVAA